MILRVLVRISFSNGILAFVEIERFDFRTPSDSQDIDFPIRFF